jgi:hypothetical protein
VSTARLKRPRAALAAVLVIAGAIAIALSATFGEQHEIKLARANVPVDRGARDPADISANNSPSIARNPRDRAMLAVVNRVDSPDYSCALHVSRDRGARWSRVRVPIARGEGHKCYAPDVDFAADGTLHMSYVTLRGNGNEPHAVWVTSSSDGGRTLTRPRRAAGPLAFQVRLRADPARPERLYLTWLQARTVGLYLFSGPGNRIVVSRSDDGGRSWRKPVPVSHADRQRVLAPAPAVGPDGALYVLYLDVGDDRLDYEGAHGGFGGKPYTGRFALVLGRSTDAGATWSESLVDDRVVPARRFLAFLPPSPSLAIDARSGRIFAAFEDGRGGRADVHVWSLASGARGWSGPTRVNDTPRPDRSSQYLPAISVAPDGRLDVAYYDRRADPSDRRNAVSLQSSFDAARTFTPHIALTDRSFDSHVGPGSERGLADIGSRIGLAADERGTLASWTDTRAGTVDSIKQDIAFAEATATSSRGLSDGARAALRYGGIALLLAGLAALFTQARARGG